MKQSLGAKTIAQVQLWHDGERLWSHQLAHDPRCTLAWNNLGAAQGAAGKLEEALRSHKNAVALAPNSPMTRVNLGITLRKLGRLDEAVEQFRAMTTTDSFCIRGSRIMRPQYCARLFKRGFGRDAERIVSTPVPVRAMKVEVGGVRRR